MRRINGKNSNSANPFPLSKSKPFSLDSSTTGEENIEPKFQNKKGSPKKSNSMDCPTKKQKIKEGSRVTRGSTGAKPSFFELLISGEHYFLSYLRDCLRAAPDDSIFIICPAREWSETQRQLFSQWIESLGFQRVAGNALEEFECHYQVGEMRTEVERAVAAIPAPIFGVSQSSVVPGSSVNPFAVDQINTGNENSHPTQRLIYSCPDFTRGRARTVSSCYSQGEDVDNELSEDSNSYDDFGTQPGISPLPLGGRAPSRSLNPSPSPSSSSSIYNTNYASLISRMSVASLASPRNLPPPSEGYFTTSNATSLDRSLDRPIPVVRSVSAPLHHFGQSSRAPTCASSELYDSYFGRPASATTLPFGNHPHPDNNTTFHPVKQCYGKNFPSRSTFIQQRSLSFEETLKEEEDDRDEADDSMNMTNPEEERQNELKMSTSTLDLTQQFADTRVFSSSTAACLSPSSSSGSSKKNRLSEGIAVIASTTSVDELEAFRPPPPATPVALPVSAVTSFPASSASSNHLRSSGCQQNSAFVLARKEESTPVSSHTVAALPHGGKSIHGTHSNGMARAHTEPINSTTDLISSTPCTHPTPSFPTQHAMHVHGGSVTPGGVSLSQNCVSHFSTPQQIKLTCKQKLEQEEIWLNSTACQQSQLQKFFAKYEYYIPAYDKRKLEEQGRMVCEGQQPKDYHSTLPSIREERGLDGMSMKEVQRSGKKRNNFPHSSPPTEIFRTKSAPTYGGNRDCDLLNSPTILGSHKKKNKIDNHKTEYSQPPQPQQPTKVYPLRRQPSLDSIPFERGSSGVLPHDYTDELFSMIDNPIIPGVNQSFGEHSYQLCRGLMSAESGDHRASSTGSSNILCYHYNDSTTSVLSLDSKDSKPSDSAAFVTTRGKRKQSDYHSALVNVSSESSQAPEYLHSQNNSNLSGMSGIVNPLNFSGGSAGGISEPGPLPNANHSISSIQEEKEDEEEKERNESRLSNEGYHTHPFQHLPAGKELQFPPDADHNGMTSGSGKFARASSINSRNSGSSFHLKMLQHTEGFGASPIQPKHSFSTRPTNSLFDSPAASQANVPSSAFSVGYGGLMESDEHDSHRISGEGLHEFSSILSDGEEPQQFVISSPNDHFPPPARTRSLSHAVVPPNTSYSAHMNTSQDAIDTSDIFNNDLGLDEEHHGGNNNVFGPEEDIDETAEVATLIDEMELEGHDEDIDAETVDEGTMGEEVGRPEPSKKWLKSKAKIRRLSQSFQMQQYLQQQQPGSLNQTNLSHSHLSDNRSQSMMSCDEPSTLELLFSSSRRRKRSSIYGAPAHSSVAYVPLPGLTINIPANLDEDNELEALHSASSVTPTTATSTPSIARSTRSRSNSRNQQNLPVSGVRTRSQSQTLTLEDCAPGSAPSSAPNSFSHANPNESPVAYRSATSTPTFCPSNVPVPGQHRRSSSTVTIPSFSFSLPTFTSESVIVPSFSCATSSATASARPRYAYLTLNQPCKDEIFEAVKYVFVPPPFATSQGNLLIIGGDFDQQFDGCCPIVTFSASFQQFFKHVTEVIVYATLPTAGGVITGCGLLLGLYDPLTQVTTWKDFSTGWCCQPVLPVGYLVATTGKPASTGEPRKTWYYLTKHPLDYVRTASDVTLHHHPLSLPVSQEPSPFYLRKFFTTPTSVLSCFMSYLTPQEQSCCLMLCKASSLSIQSIRFQQSIAHLITLSAQDSSFSPLELLQQATVTFCHDYSVWDKFVDYLMQHPYGKYLADGACKEVYRVQSLVQTARNEPMQEAVKVADSALSVMDLKDLLAREIEPSMILSELAIALMTSYLTKQMRCAPSFVQVHQLFQSTFPIPAGVWKESLCGEVPPGSQPSIPAVVQQLVNKKRKPSIKNGGSCFQYIQTEFCSGGDVEAHLRAIKVVPQAQELVSWLFQLCYAMYVARVELDLYHGDIKLLNFFIASSSSICPSTSASAPNIRSLVIGFDRTLYTLPMHQHDPCVLKLSDFGTSRLSASQTFGCPISVHHFTTLENTPPEYFLLGNSCYPSFASDTFALGLCFLHLLTGYAPYEELLESVHCPGYLVEQLALHWCPKKSKKHSEDEPHAYQVITDVIDSLVDEETEGGSSKKEKDKPVRGQVFYDTFYRYLVLMSDFPSFWKSGLVENDLYRNNPIYKILQVLFQFQPSSPPKPVGKGKASRIQDCRFQFQQDREKFSIMKGNDPIMKQLRNRCDALGLESMNLLESMLHWNPTSRCTMYEALHSSLFSSFLPTSPVSGVLTDPQSVVYCQYYRPPVSLRPSHSQSSHPSHSNHNPYSGNNNAPLLPIV